jgi:hypothetical protein
VTTNSAPSPPPPSIVYLLGYPGVGKYTVGRELARRTGAALIDNQVINHPILTLFNWDGKSQLPPGTLDRAAPIRDAVLTALEEIAPLSMSYVFTNVLADEPEAIALYERIKRVALSRSSLFVPVMLTCALEVQLGRVGSDERVRRFKISDPEGVQRLMAAGPLYVPDDPALLTLDTTTSPPQYTASLIVEAIRRLEASDNAVAKP